MIKTTEEMWAEVLLQRERDRLLALNIKRIADIEKQAKNKKELVTMSLVQDPPTAKDLADFQTWLQDTDQVAPKTLTALANELSIEQPSEMKKVVGGYIPVPKSAMYILKIPNNTSDSELSDIKNSFRALFKDNNISAPVIMLPNSYEFAGSDQFDFSTALVLLKHNHSVRSESRGIELYMEYGVIYLYSSDKAKQPDDEWTPAQADLVVTDYRIVR